jgi:hypothetical protein
MERKSFVVAAVSSIALLVACGGSADAFFAETLVQTHQGDHNTSGDPYYGNGVFTKNEGIGQTSTTTVQDFVDDLIFAGAPQREEHSYASANLATSQVRSSVDGAMLVSGLQGGAINVAAAAISDGASATRPGGPPFGHLAGDVVTFNLDVSGSFFQNAPNGSNFNGSIIGLIVAQPGTLTPLLDFESPNWICRFYWGIGDNVDVLYANYSGGPVKRLPLNGKLTSFPTTLSASCPSGGAFDWAVYIRTSYAAFAESSWSFDFAHTIDVSASLPDGVTILSTGSGYALPAGAPPVLPPTDSYLSYKTKGTKGSLCASDAPVNASAACDVEEDCGGVSSGDGETTYCVANKFPKGIEVALSDLLQPDAQVYDVKKPLTLDAPADVAGGGTSDADTHLRGYAIALAAKRCGADAPTHAGEGCKVETDCGGTKGTTSFCQAQTKFDKQTGITVRDAFHPDASPALTLDAIKPERVLVPTSKGLAAFLPAPSAPVDHYTCYKVATTKGAPKFHTIAQIAVDDAFTPAAKLFDLKKPAHLCMAANQNGAGVPNPNGNLMCYQAVGSKGQPRHVAVSGLFLANELLQEQADTQKEEELCVPADVLLPVTS